MQSTTAINYYAGAAHDALAEGRSDTTIKVNAVDLAALCALAEQAESDGWEVCDCGRGTIRGALTMCKKCWRETGREIEMTVRGGTDEQAINWPLQGA